MAAEGLHAAVRGVPYVQAGAWVLHPTIVEIKRRQVVPAQRQRLRSNQKSNLLNFSNQPIVWRQSSVSQTRQLGRTHAPDTHLSAQSMYGRLQAVTKRWIVPFWALQPPAGPTALRTGLLRWTGRGAHRPAIDVQSGVYAACVTEMKPVWSEAGGIQMRQR